MTRRSTAIRDKHRAQVARYHPPCHICGQPIDYDLPSTDPMGFVLDHVDAYIHSGDDSLANKAAAHRVCNRAKSDKPYAPIIRRSATLV